MRLAFSLFVAAAAAWLLFWNLGANPFWGDEADTALFARGVWETGDTTAIVGDNLYAFRSGELLTNLRNRYTPPLPYYVVAPFWGLAGNSTFWLRFPFAACGLATICVLLAWLWRSRAAPLTWLLVSICLLGNVAFFLFSRQCRYYALATLASTAIVYLYANYRGRKTTAWGLALWSVILLATQYLNFAALAVALAIDYALWQRKSHPFARRHFVAIGTTIVITGCWLASIWNPLGKAELAGASEHGWLVDRLTLAWWNPRDLDTAEFIAAPVIALALIFAWRSGDVWLRRSLAGLAAYLATIVLLSPEPVSLNTTADVRYLAPLLPLCIWMTARVACQLANGMKVRAKPQAAVWGAVAIVFAVLAAGTNILHLPLSPSRWRATPAEFVAEIVHPRPTAIARTANWLNTRAAPGSSVFVMYGFDMYPLMVHAPRMRYAWQLEDPPKPQFAGLESLNFFGREPVDYLVAFGPADERIQEVIALLAKAGVRYVQVANHDIDSDDGLRPELTWHRFRPRTDFDKTKDGVFIYRRVR
jgi:4-amino-4-deoxy-L-arabinose transferase-like glycosyltransferase